MARKAWFLVQVSAEMELDNVQATPKIGQAILVHLLGVTK